MTGSIKLINISQSTMQKDNKPSIEFTQQNKGFSRTNSGLTNDSIQVQFAPISFDTRRKTSDNKKIKTPSKKEEKVKYQKALNSVCKLPISVKLLNLLRNPCINHHLFQSQYLKQLQETFIHLNCKIQEDQEMALYIHLILAQIENLQQMQELSQGQSKVESFNLKTWNSTNLMNTKCILTLLQRLPPLTSNTLPEEKFSLWVDIINNENICILDESFLTISKNYIKLALQSNGHLDVYFGPFLLNKFDFQSHFWFANFNENQQALINYSKIFEQIATENSEFTNMDFQKWYNEQVNKIINNQFHTEDLVPFLNHTRYNPWVQKLLIGLQGWKGLTDSAIRLLNVYYDNCDWQINSNYNSSIYTTGDAFEIDYLIDNPKSHQRTLVYCLHAPCLDPSVPLQIFSWHIPELVEYTYDEISYVWAKMDMGTYPRSGFYNYAMFNLLDHGKQVVNKILDIRNQHKILGKSQSKGNPILTIKSVKGRMIVQPKNTRDLSLHQINVDSLASEEGHYRSSNFDDATRQLDRYSQEGINAIYLAGVFERDNQPTGQVFRKPNASPMAFTHRTLACKMLGGNEGLKRLISKAHSLNIKVIVDCTARVSSSHMSKRYEGLKLKAVDDQGRIVFHYGANGRSISYDDSTPLNYRKKQAWDLLLAQTIEIVEQFQVDGLYLDNGFDWPPVYQINSEQLFRNELSDNSQVYSNSEIFQGTVVVPNKIAGFWASPLISVYPNPFLIHLTKKLWELYPNLILIAEALQFPQNDNRIVSVIRSGPIPRTFKMPKALSQVVGIHLSSKGDIKDTTVKHLTNLKKWYDQIIKVLPKGSIMIQSTTSPVWPYLSLIFKKATWAVIDLYLLMPMLTMTSGSELLGHAYKSKSININYIPAQSTNNDLTQNNKGFSRANSSFMREEFPTGKRGNVINCVNTTLKDPSQIKYLQTSHRKQVGPEFGFDLQQIHKHYAHRRQLRMQHKVLRDGRLMSVTAQHSFGIHNNVLSFARYDQNHILLISINFNANQIDMHYNLSTLKALFKHHQRSNIVLKLQSILNPSKFVDEYYLASQLISSKINAHIKPYQTIIWKLTIQNSNCIEKAITCSSQRIAQRLSRQPPAWIYSSVFFNQLTYLLKTAKHKSGIVNGLNQLYNKCIMPEDISFSMLISKNHEFYVNKHKLQKLFGVFQLISQRPELNPLLKHCIKRMISGNTLGPIAFVTPQIGSWSSVGGLGVMVDQLSKELARLGQDVYIITPYYQFNKKKQTNYLQRDGFNYECNIKVKAAHFNYQFGIHRGKYCGVNYIWYHNSELFSKPYEGQGASYVSKQLVFFALTTLEIFCQLKIFPSMVVTNDWMCGFVSAYVKTGKFDKVFNGTKFMHICHNLDPLYEGRLYPKIEEGNLEWLIGLPPQWYIEHTANKLIINPSKCALETCDNWGTVSNSYKIQLLKESDLSGVLWKHPHPFSFPNGIRKDQRLAILMTKTPGNHLDSKALLQKKYFKCDGLKQVPLFSFIGRVTRQKGVHLILEAVEALLFEQKFNIQFLVGGMADSKEEYGKYCAQKMKYLHAKYPQCFWSNPDQFFVDGPLVNFGSNFSVMPSMFQPGGIVQHQFFCAGTPVITFCTGGLKDTVFEYDPEKQKGNGFNFLSYDLQDFKRCMRRALLCFKNKASYQKLRQNAADSVVEEEDVARGWNNQFYRMQNKIYIDKARVQKQIERFLKKDEPQSQQAENIKLFNYKPGEYWKPNWEVIGMYKEVLHSASRLQFKLHIFNYQTKKIPRPKEIFVIGSWDDWHSKTKLNFDKIYKNYKISIKLKPNIYHYKYIVDGDWTLNENEQHEEDEHGIINNKVIIE